jgi:dienelactone hydrolase
MTSRRRSAAVVRLLLAGAALLGATALPLADDALPVQSEFGPAAGKGRVVVVVSGQTGPGSYEYFAKDLAAQGYDAVLVDGNDFWKVGGGEALLRGVIERAQQSPHALPGKVAVVGFSLGGASTLSFAARMPDLVAAVVTYYPLTAYITDPADFVARLKVPVLLMAGVKDTYKNCCRIETARKLAEAARGTEGAVKLELVEYLSAEHGFTIKAGRSWRSGDAEDGFKRTLAHLRANLAD